MANQIASISSAIGLLKTWFAGPIVTQFNDMLPLYREMENGREKYNGTQVNRPLKVRRNQGIGAVADGGLLPNTGQQTTVQAVVSAKFNYLRFAVTGPMMKASRGDKGSFADVITYEMEQGLEDLKNDVNRQLYWDGTSDLATVAANVLASNVVTVSGRSTGEIGAKFLDVGATIDIYTSAGALVASNLTIQSISNALSATATLVLSANVNSTAGDIVVRAGSFGNEIQGLLTTLDGGTSSLYSVDRSLYPSYQGNSISASGAQLTLSKMQQAYNEARRRGNGKVDTILMDFDSEAMYNKLLVADKRYIGKVPGDGTFSKKEGSYLEYAGVPIVPDKDSPTNMFFLDRSTWKKYVLAELEWADESGAYMIAQTSTDAYEARLRLFANVFCEKPSANARLSSYISP